MLYSISIVSHKQINLCTKAINTILKLVQDPEIILTINVEEPLDDLNIQCNNLILINNEQPLGFGQNHNNAFRKSSGKLFLIVNPDIEIIHWENFSFEENTLYSPKVLDINGQPADNQRSYPTPLNLFQRKILKKTESKLDWFGGMFLIVPRKLFQKVDGFDERFFMYLEDTDLSLRVKKSGGKLKVIKSCIVIHDAQRKSTKEKIHFYYHITSLFKFYLKHPCLIFN